MASQVETQTVTSGLLSLRGYLWSGGLTGATLDEALGSVLRVSSHGAAAERVRAALAHPEALAARMVRAAPRPLSFEGVIGALVLGAVAGPAAAYAALAGPLPFLVPGGDANLGAVALGDPFNAYPHYVPRWAGAVVGVVLLFLLLWFAARYRRSATVGLIAGFAGGVTEIVLAVLPWVAVTGSKTGCLLTTCTVAQEVPRDIGIFAAVSFAIPFLLAVTGVAATYGLWAQRRRMDAAVRSA